MSVFTVGNEKNYDRGIASCGREFKKLGKDLAYPGGYACRTPEDARKLIVQEGRESEWAVYELEADWEKDTESSENGWWHVLLLDAVIVRKVEVG